MTDAAQHLAAPVREALTAYAEAMFDLGVETQLGSPAEKDEAVEIAKLTKQKLLAALAAVTFAPEGPSPSVTRIEVIDHRHGAPTVGRVFAAWNARCELSYQDGGRTLKMFVDDPLPSGEQDRPKP